MEATPSRCPSATSAADHEGGSAIGASAEFSRSTRLATIAAHCSSNTCKLFWSSAGFSASSRRPCSTLLRYGAGNAVGFYRLTTTSTKSSYKNSSRSPRIADRSTPPGSRSTLAAVAARLPGRPDTPAGSFACSASVDACSAAGASSRQRHRGRSTGRHPMMPQPRGSWPARAVFRPAGSGAWLSTGSSSCPSWRPPGCGPECGPGLPGSGRAVCQPSVQV